MKSLIPFLRHVLADASTRCDTESTTADIEYISRRVEHEGMSFLTISLSNFGKDFERSLDQGYIASDQYAGFPRTGGLPRLFSGFLRLVFDRASGRLLDVPSIDAIQAIRQLTLMFGKINLPCTDARTAAAIRQYVECDKEVAVSDRILEGMPERLASFERLSILLWADILADVNQQVYYGQIVPGHGPGATADKLKGNLKWRQLEWTRRLDEVFPVEEYLATSWSFYEEVRSAVTILEPGTERPVKVVTVPKTLKTPRIIAIEPTCMQYIQQGLMHSIREAVEADDFASQLIGWSSQLPNQEMARTGSSVGDLATLDLSEASDRVSTLHVRSLLGIHRHLLDGVEACRSLTAEVPGHGVIALNKYASMGSALTFPLEAMVFATVIFVAIEKELNRPMSRKDIESFRGKVRVYGDDIIVPVHLVSAVIEELEAFGFRVNSSKSFWTGKFRESCGKEYYHGEDVSIVRVRELIPTSQHAVPELVSTLETRNLFYKAGYWNTARYLDNQLKSLIPLPVVAEEAPMLGRHSFLGYDVSESRLCPDLQRPLVKGVRIRSVIPDSRLEGHSALLKCLTKRGDMPFADVRHLERAGRPLSLALQQGWYSPV